MSESESITNKIRKLLEKENRRTVNELYEDSGKTTTIGYFRTAINRLKKRGVIEQDGNKGKEFCFSLAERINNPIKSTKKLLNFLNELKENDYSETEVQYNSFIKTLEKHINQQELKDLEAKIDEFI